MVFGKYGKLYPAETSTVARDRAVAATARAKFEKAPTVEENFSPAVRCIWNQRVPGIPKEPPLEPPEPANLRAVGAK